MSTSAQQARTLYEQRKFAECEHLCREMLRADPTDVDALSTLGYLGMQAGEPEMAAKYLEQAANLEPGYPGHLGALATALRMASRHEDALLAQERAVALAPDDPAALTNLALQYAEAGRFDEAAQHYERAIEIQPTLGQAHYGLSLIRKFEPADPRIERLRELHAEPQLQPTDRAAVAFSLGRAYDDLDEPDQAFGYFAEGNALKKKQSHYDAAAEKRYAQALCAVFDKPLLEQNIQAGNPSDLPVFVIGMPRSGSTLVEQVLAAHPNIAASGELPWAGRALDQGLASALDGGQSWPAGARNIAPRAWRAMGDAYIERIGEPDGDIKRHIDKQLFNYLLVGPLHLMLPGARFVYCRRNPLDTCVSCFTNNFGGDRGFSNDLEDLGAAFANCEMLMAHWKKWLPEGTLIEIAYEQMVADLETESRRLLDFLGLPWAPQCLAFADTERAVITSSLRQVRSGIYQSSVGRWRRFAKHLAPLQHALGLAGEA